MKKYDALDSRNPVWKAMIKGITEAADKFEEELEELFALKKKEEGE